MKNFIFPHSFFLLIVLFVSLPLYSQELTEKELFLKCEGSVVVVEAYDNYNNLLGQGSGVVINEKGWIVTNYHVYKNPSYNAKSLKIKHEDTYIQYTDIIGFDISKDLLILKIDIEMYNFPSILIGDSDILEVGDKICAIGSPLGYENSLSCGIISGLGRIVNIQCKAIQITCVIDHGSSGGAVVNMKGELIGISYYGKGNLFFAIPVNEIFNIYLTSYGKEDDENYIDYFYLGNKAVIDKRFNDAIYYYSIYIEKFPNNSSAYNNRGYAYSELYKEKKAISDYSKAISLDPTNPLYYYNRGFTYYCLKKYDKACKDFRKAYALGKYDVEFWMDRTCDWED